VVVVPGGTSLEVTAVLVAVLVLGQVPESLGKVTKAPIQIW
jgi:hypothetical protein